MMNLNEQVLDTVYRVLVPSEIREQLGWGINITLTALVNQESAVVTLYLASQKLQLHGKISMVNPMLDNLGRVCLAQATCKSLGWGENDIISLQPCIQEGTLALKRVKKHM